MSTEAFDLISIGGGSGGLACAQRAAEYGAKTAVIESGRLGRHLCERRLRPEKGDVERGEHCPGAEGRERLRLRHHRGRQRLGRAEAKRDAYIVRLNGIYARNLAAKGVKHVRGTARFVDAHTVEVNGERLTAPHVVIATGSIPIVPPLPGAELGITSDGFFELERRPQRVAVVGQRLCRLRAGRRVP